MIVFAAAVEARPHIIVFHGAVHDMGITLQEITPVPEALLAVGEMS